MPSKYPQKKRDYNRKWQKEHPKWMRAKNKRYRKKYPKRVRKSIMKWRENNRLQHNNYMRKYNIDYRFMVRVEVLTHYGNGKLQCVCCQEKEIGFLTIDHPNGKSTWERKHRLKGANIYGWLRARNFPRGYRTLCWNCNCGRALNHGICPHKKHH